MGARLTFAQLSSLSHLAVDKFIYRENLTPLGHLILAHGQARLAREGASFAGCSGAPLIQLVAARETSFKGRSIDRSIKWI